MKVSGFTIVRNAVKLDYPVVESITSILPVCDEFWVNIGDSEDETLELIRTIGTEKLRIIENRWDTELRQEGEILSQQTNIALSHCTGDWAFYLQADEVVHEKYLECIQQSMRENLGRLEVEGLSFRYRHFYGSYHFYQDNFRKWYTRQVRIIRRRDDIVSWGDAMDFKHRDGSNLKSVNTGAEIFHYGWVKPPAQMLAKKKELDRYWHDDAWLGQRYREGMEFEYPDRKYLVPFKGTHPQVMQQRVESQNWELPWRWSLYQIWPIRKLAVFFEPLTRRVRKWGPRLQQPSP